MTPEDKAMTEKAMMSSNTEGIAGKIPLKDLPSSSIDLAASVVTKTGGDTKGTAPPKTTPGSTPSLADAPFNPATPPVVPPVPESKKRGFLKLPFFHRKPRTAAVEMAKTSDVAEQLTNESLLKMIDDKLHKISGDEFLMVKISKQGLLILVGFVLVLVWLSPLIELNLPKVLSNRYKLLTLMKIQSPSPAPTTFPAPTPIPLTDSTIRVRMGSNSLDAANEVKNLLTAAGFSHIDLVYDPQVNPKSLLIVTKKENEALKQTLNKVFTDKYAVASEAAELTSDSDFAASILVGKSAKLTK